MEEFNWWNQKASPFNWNEPFTGFQFENTDDDEEFDDYEYDDEED